MSIQSIYGVSARIQSALKDGGFYKGPIDALIGPLSKTAVEQWLNIVINTHIGMITTFADPEDVRRYKQKIAEGYTPEQAFKYGDNGEGCWGDDTTVDFAYCAIPPDDMIARFGSGKNMNKARGAKIMVHDRMKKNSVAVEVRDRMPWKKYIKNGAVIDLNECAIRALGYLPGVRIEGWWEWV